MKQLGRESDRRRGKGPRNSRSSWRAPQQGPGLWQAITLFREDPGSDWAYATFTPHTDTRRTPPRAPGASRPPVRGIGRRNRGSMEGKKRHQEQTREDSTPGYQCQRDQPGQQSPQWHSLQWRGLQRPESHHLFQLQREGLLHKSWRPPRRRPRPVHRLLWTRALRIPHPVDLVDLGSKVDAILFEVNVGVQINGWTLIRWRAWSFEDALLGDPPRQVPRGLPRSS